MSIAEARSSTLTPVLVSAVAIVLLVNGMFNIYDGDWGANDLLGVLGLFGVLWVIRTQAGQGGWRRRQSPWLVLLIGSVVLVVLGLSAVGVVCGNEQGFSCGG